MSDTTLDACDACIAERGVDTSASGWRTSLTKPPQFEFDASKKYFWNIETTQGPIRVRLRPDVAPMHVSSTVYLARLGFYDGLPFHRVITGFMAQGGCPLGNGTGGPGYKYDGEFDATVRHDRGGLLSMANAGPGTDGSQFFLTFAPTDWLDGKHTIFGEVAEGVETLDALQALGSSSGATSKPVSMTKTTIEVE